MQLTMRLPQTDPAANLAAGTPSKTRRDFFPRRRAQQTPFRESVRGCGCTKSRCRRFESSGVDSVPMRRFACKEAVNLFFRHTVNFRAGTAGDNPDCFYFLWAKCKRFDFAV